jgi:thiamine biosynthesis lipoprotein
MAIRQLSLGCLIAISTLLAACDRPTTIRLEGEAQGTTYHITVVDYREQLAAPALQQAVEQRLAAIDRALSNYRDDSGLAAFNRAPPGAWIALGDDLYRVLALSAQISRGSDGVFDITAAPLIDLWGFGPQRELAALPDAVEIERIRAEIGYRHLELDASAPRARKSRPLTIDVNGIAQGYTVDALAAVLEELGCSDYLVELGGELRMRGHNPARKPWRIGIQIPGADSGAAEQAITGSNIAITTAGDYRDYFERDGVRYSHTIDPRSGRPVAHRLASVTVVAASAALADGYDTVLEVLGPEAGMAWAQQRGIAAYFIVRTDDGFSTLYSDAMRAYLR